MGCQRSVRVAYVASVEHSGSTILDLLIGAQGEAAVSAGEVRLALIGARRDPDDVAAWPCTCGRLAGECELWGEVFARLASLPHPVHDGDAYSVLLEVVEERFGPDRVLVDSSKDERFLARVRPVIDDLVILRLTRDVRSWTPSGRRLHYPDGPWRMALAARDARSVGLAARATTPGLYLRWYRKNRGLDRAVAAAGAPVLRLGHEEMLADPAGVLAAVLNFVGLDGDPERVVLDTTRQPGHVISGNAVRHHPERRQRVMGDLGWLADPPGLPWPSLLRPIMRYNAEAVYGRS